ncbi:MAG: hypothetical protein JJU31_14750 [Wenzhouxiangella sp.]|nr:hypothetical protein [Wenzhouxiangella sp.]MCH8479257.1 hypothetical protein [Wenzhouxiangella sp.]TVR94049.1 MAG: hypothetical protein EA418_10950 [Wenzhouxiangellaceae bacterium]
MRHLQSILVFLLSLSFGIVQAGSIDFENIAIFDPNAHAGEVTECDRLAAHPSDPHRVTEGLTRAEMDLDAVMVACHAALEDDPYNPRLNYQLARAYGYAGRHEEGDSYRHRALMAGYPQSLFVMGYIMVTGWDGSDPRPCAGGELIRRSAHTGRYAGLVAFPHYYLMGHFADCGDYPLIDREEMLGFLDQAASSDFYQSILVDQLMLQLRRK